MIRLRLAAAFAAAVLIASFVFAPVAPAAASGGEITVHIISPRTGECTPYSGTAQELEERGLGVVHQNGDFSPAPGVAYGSCPTAPPDPGPQPAALVEYGEWSAETPTCDMPSVVQTRSVTTTEYVLSSDRSQWVPGSPALSSETQNVSLTEVELAACAPTDPGPQPPDYIDYGPWGNQVPSCDVPVVTQSRMVATTPYVLNEDGSDWILGGTVLTTGTQEVSLSDEELAACPTGSDPGPRPDDVVKVESYEGDASCESGTVEVITVTKTTTYYLGDDNKYYLSDRPSTDREVSSRDMTADERTACAPDSKPIPPGPAPLVNAGSLTTALPNTGSGNSTHHSVAAAVLLLEGIGGVVALILAMAVYSYDNRRRPWSH